MIDALTIKDGMTVVMEQVFGRVLLCTNITIAMELAKSRNLNCHIGWRCGKDIIVIIIKFT